MKEKKSERKHVLLSPSMAQSLSDYARKSGLSENKVIEKALSSLFHQEMDILKAVSFPLETVSERVKRIENLINLSIINQDALMDWIVPIFFITAKEMHGLGDKKTMKNEKGETVPMTIKDQVKKALRFYSGAQKLYREWKVENYGLYSSAIEAELVMSQILDTGKEDKPVKDSLEKEIGEEDGKSKD